MKTPAKVGIFVFDDVEVLDFAGPFEVFSITRGLEEDDNASDGRLFEPVIIAENEGLVHAVGDLIIQPHYTIATHPPLDLLVIPGGKGTRPLQEHSPVLDWIAEQSAQISILASVCTGALLLGYARQLDGLSATTHWGSIERMRAAFPGTKVMEEVRLVDNGHVVTSAGISAGIDMSLALVGRLHGLRVAQQTARYMEYDWRPR